MPSEIIICVALCMFMDGKLVEHTYQSSMADCLRNKRIAERTIQPERVQFACGADIEAEVEYVEEVKVELVCPEKKMEQVLKALRDAHPYEEPAIDVFKLYNME